MKNANKIFTIASLLMICFAVKAFSQTTTTTKTEKTPITVEQKTTNVVDEMTKVAALTPDQVSKVTPIVEEFLKQKEIDIAKCNGNKNALEDARKARVTNLNNKLKEVVTQPQFVKIKENWNKKKEQKASDQGLD